MKKAEKEHKRLKGLEIANNKVQNESIANNIKHNMLHYYPTINAIGKEFENSEKYPHPEKKITFEYLINRINLLEEILIESEIPINNSNETQDKLNEILKCDVMFLMSITYILGQIFSLLNKFSTLVDLKSIEPNLATRLPDYITLRNVLEHTDPIFDSIDLPYYQMHNNLSPIMTSVIIELIYKYKENIINIDVSKLHKLPQSNYKRLKQTHAINPQNFWLSPKNDIKNTSTLKHLTNDLTTGYIRHKVFGDGDCGYTAFGITRNQAYQLLKDNLNAVRALLQPAIKEALLTETFINYLEDQGQATSGLLTAFRQYQQTADQGNNIDTAIKQLYIYADDLVILAAYLAYDIRDKKIDAGWIHPATLQALADIQKVEIYIWQLGDDERLISHHQVKYASYVPKISNSRLDLLFVNNNHFELLQVVELEAKESVNYFV